MSAGYEKAIRANEGVPHAQVVFDPFHVCQLASRAVDDVRRAEWNEHDKSKTKAGRWIKHSRWSLLKAPERGCQICRVSAWC
jgi:transposase